jgi:hypothetical protein
MNSSNTKSIQIKICTYFHFHDDVMRPLSLFSLILYLCDMKSAQCLEYDDQPENYLVEYSTTTISDGLNGVQIAFVEDLIYHENFDPDKLNDDIGLIKLKYPLQLNTVGWRAKLALRNEYFPTGTPAVLAGDNFITSHLYELFYLKFEDNY